MTVKKRKIFSLYFHQNYHFKEFVWKVLKRQCFGILVCRNLLFMSHLNLEEVKVIQTG